ncbi:hypothetical protein FQA47_017746 [Oryzias melastigma]|uniref:Uncharacterized protein n=1 Tax=Oryzias melastigma TaxID=30732 RepID=A0A834F3B9_ORYME|nr:hypothetical protein FQA47_017746 [Oryzias melastigma]
MSEHLTRILSAKLILKKPSRFSHSLRSNLSGFMSAFDSRAGESADLLLTCPKFPSASVEKHGGTHIDFRDLVTVMSQQGFSHNEENKRGSDPDHFNLCRIC